MPEEQQDYDHPHEAHHHPHEENDHEVVDRPGFFVGGLLGFIAGSLVVVIVVLLILLGMGVIGGATAP